MSILNIRYFDDNLGRRGIIFDMPNDPRYYAHLQNDEARLRLVLSERLGLAKDAPEIERIIQEFRQAF